MRHKQWPFLDDWNEIFGKDRVTGDKRTNESRSSGKKRAAVDENFNDKLCELLRQHFRSREKWVEIILRGIGYKADLGKARKEAFSMLHEIPDLSIDEKIDACHMLAKETGRIELFLGMPKDVRALYVRRLLDGNIGNPA